MSFEIDVAVKMRDWAEATRAGVSITQREIRNRTREQIRGTGMSNAARGLNTKARKIEGGWIIQVFQSPSYMKVYEYGGTSVGRPFLWMPVGLGLKGIPAKRNRLLIQPGRRRPILIWKDTGKVAYVGIRSITHRPRFRIREISHEEAVKFLERLAI